MFIIYDGPSLIDGLPIVAIATINTDNAKTGDMIQTWIMRSDLDPVSASRTGADYSICGNCQHRGRPHNGTTGWAKQRSCYVNLLFGPSKVFQTYRRGRYQHTDDLASVGRNRLIRIGSYGDGAAVPQQIWDELCSEAKGWTAYTHQSNARPDRYMTSADSLPQAQQAWARGERTFRVIKSALDLQPNEILCPASEEAGKRTTCANCKLCAGASIAAKNIGIVAHGSGARHFA